jgi:ATP-dependent helicase YprA (DUF1998 family)
MLSIIIEHYPKVHKILWARLVPHHSLPCLILGAAIKTRLLLGWLLTCGTPQISKQLVVDFDATLVAPKVRLPLLRRGELWLATKQPLYFVFLTLFPIFLQRLAIQAFLRGSSVVVSAPTSSGKTLIAEAAAVATVARGRRLFYTTPLKALSNQKFRDFR